MTLLDATQKRITELCQSNNMNINNKISTPVILLTAKSSIQDRVVGLDLGADDYLPKPFNTEELLARVRALGRRNSPYQDKNEVTFGDIAINENT